jgi:hypothetical protein
MRNLGQLDGAERHCRTNCKRVSRSIWSTCAWSLLTKTRVPLEEAGLGVRGGENRRVSTILGNDPSHVLSWCLSTRVVHTRSSSHMRQRTRAHFM